MIDSYPLKWPENQPRTAITQTSNFGLSISKASNFLKTEVERLNGTDIVISSNMSFRRDGLPHAKQGQPSDTGVAVYFWRNGKAYCMACDRYNKVEHNMNAIAKTIEAMRGIQRWGSIGMAERTVEAFAYLPEKVSGTYV